MGQQLFVIKKGVLPAKGLPIASIVAGKAGITLEGTSVVEDAPAVGDKVQIISKGLDNTPEVSTTFSPKDIVKKSIIAPTTGIAQVSKITLVVPDTQKRGDIWSVKLIDATFGTRSPAVTNIIVYREASDYTVETLTDAFVTKINTAKLGITATNVADVLTLTADDTATAFRLAIDNMTEGSTIEYTTSNVHAAGTPAVIKALESYLKSFDRGIPSQTFTPVNMPSSNVEDTATYTLYVFDMLIPTPDCAGVGYARAANYKLYIAEADADVNNHVGKLIADLV